MSGIGDVAREVGVSTATVSRALRGLPGVAAPTRRRILAAAAELQYVASPQASSLASGRTRTVAVVVPYVDRWYFGQVLRGAGEVLAAAGYAMLLYALDGREDRRAAVFPSTLLRKRVDGVLVVSIVPQPPEVLALGFLGPRVVTVGSSVPGWTAVLVDDVAVGRSATQHLLALGHRDIALVGARTPHEFGFTAPARRLQGYREALAAAGVPFRREWALPADFRADAGAQAVDRLLRLTAAGSGQLPTAVLAATDELALGVIAELGRRGIAVPEQLSVMGVDDHEMAAVQGLSTVAQDVVEQGRTAAAALLAVLEPVGPALEAAAVGSGATILAPTRVVARASTAAAPAEGVRVHPDGSLTLPGVHVTLR